MTKSAATIDDNEIESNEVDAECEDEDHDYAHPVYADKNGVPTVLGLKAMFAAIDRTRL